MPLRSQLSIQLAVCVIAFGLTACATSPDLATRLAGGDRSAKDKARDAGRRPAAVVEFLGIEDGMTVIDLLAAGGYYSDVLSEAVGPDGKVYAQNGEFMLKMRGGVNDKAMTARLANGRRPNIERLDRGIDDLGLEPGSVDVAVTALNFHDIVNGRGARAAANFLAAVREILADEGVLGIIDHAGNGGPGDEALHRIEESKVIKTVESAGFVLDGVSDVLSNPEDDRSKKVFAEGMRGHTDRFVLRFRKAKEG